MLWGTDIIPIMSIPRNFVMDLNNVMPIFNNILDIKVFNKVHVRNELILHGKLTFDKVTIKETKKVKYMFCA